MALASAAQESGGETEEAATNGRGAATGGVESVREERSGPGDDRVPGPGSITESEVFRLLGNDRRRAVLRQVVDGGAVDLSEASKTIARVETEGEEVSSSQYKSVYVSLQQSHLPKLADAGVVDYDSESNVVGPGPHIADAREYLRPESEPVPHPSLQVVLATSAVGLLLVLAAEVGVPGVATVGSSVWGVLALLVVTLGLSLEVTGRADG
jgi:DNA-binding transcriptional ArsR family regulator